MQKQPNPAERSRAAGITPPKKTLTFLCKEGEQAAWSGQLFVAGRQEQSKAEQKEKRALPRTSHISDQQTRSTVEEWWAAGLGWAPHGVTSWPTAAEICPHQGKRGARRTRRRTVTVYKREKTPALWRKEGRRVFPAGVYFPCEEERKIDLNRKAALCRDFLSGRNKG